MGGYGSPYTYDLYADVTIPHVPYITLPYLCFIFLISTTVLQTRQLDRFLCKMAQSPKRRGLAEGSAFCGVMLIKFSLEILFPEKSYCQGLFKTAFIHNVISTSWLFTVTADADPLKNISHACTMVQCSVKDDSLLLLERAIFFPVEVKPSSPINMTFWTTNYASEIS
jgi:hypothetical protein